MDNNLLIPDWPAPTQVKAIQTLRGGGVSQPPWASLNLGGHVGDSPEDVAENRRRTIALLPQAPVWLTQVHSNTALELPQERGVAEADAAFTRQPGEVCVVLTADCLPILLCNRSGSCVAAIHAGWRGLAAGIIESTLSRMQVSESSCMAWLGPAISQQAFEVGPEVRAEFLRIDSSAATAFRPGDGDRWFADLYQLARQRLAAAGVHDVFGGEHCTYREPAHFFSYRRDGVTGRMGSFIWIDP